MSLNLKVQAAVDLAFKKVDSLLLDVVFENKSSSSFNFAAGTVNTTDTTYTTRGLLESKKKMVNGSLVTKLILTIKTAGVVLSGYTLVTVEGIAYNCSVSKGDQFITVFELVGV